MLNVTAKNNNSIDTSFCSANQLNNYFKNSIPSNNNDASDVIESYNNSCILPNISKLKFTAVDVSQVASILSSLKSKSMGSDNINVEMLKLCCPIILPYLTHIINSCIIENIFPQQWRESIIVPIPKIAQPRECRDLRPISLLPTASKILEKILNQQIRQHLEQYKILPEIQSGFRPNHSCTTALLKITDDIMCASDDGKMTILTLLDFSKAFDTLNHSILLSILKYIGLDDSAIELLKNYLFNRVQRVKLHKEISAPLNVTRGVPQGSILGPLLYTIYTCNFHKFIKASHHHMFADDIQLYHSFDFQNAMRAMMDINSDLFAISEIAKKHDLLINPLKSVSIIFGNKNKCKVLQDTVKLSIDNVEIPVVLSAKNLGLIMDNSFRYRDQILSYVKRSFCTLKILYPHRQYLTQNIKTLLCESLVLSNFAYCSQVYGICLDYDTARRAQRVQNSCLRYIFGIRKYDHISHKLAELSWLNMENRRTLTTACFFHKILTNKQPMYLYRKVKFRSDIHSINIRLKDAITPPLHKTSLYERSFSFNIYNTYNNLLHCLSDVLKCSTINVKIALRKLLLSRQST